MQLNHKSKYSRSAHRRLIEQPFLLVIDVRTRNRQDRGDQPVARLPVQLIVQPSHLQERNVKWMCFAASWYISPHFTSKSRKVLFTYRKTANDRKLAAWLSSINWSIFWINLSCALNALILVAPASDSSMWLLIGDLRTDNILNNCLPDGM